MYSALLTSSLTDTYFQEKNKFQKKITQLEIFLSAIYFLLQLAVLLIHFNWYFNGLELIFTFLFKD